MSYYELDNMPQRSMGFGNMGPDYGLGRYSQQPQWQSQIIQSPTPQIIQSPTPAIAGVIPTWYAALPIINTAVLIISLIIMIFLLFKKHH